MSDIEKLVELVNKVDPMTANERWRARDLAARVVIEIEQLKGGWSRESIGAIELAKKCDTLRQRVDDHKKHADEAIGLLNDALDHDDFQPCYHERNHMIGPALRGNLERARAALIEAWGSG